MPANAYRFQSRWTVQGTCQEVADIIGDIDGLCDWWPSVYLDAMETDPGDANQIGRTINLWTKGWLPYTLRWTLRVTENRAPFGSRFDAEGDFVGRGAWTFEQAGTLVLITFDWEIMATKPLLRRLSPLLKPLFARNHRWAMARGEESLRLELRRRRAASPAERAAVPPPPAPTWPHQAKKARASAGSGAEPVAKA